MISSYRINPERAEKLKNKSFDLSMEAREHIRETHLISYALDVCGDAFKIQDGKFIGLDLEVLKQNMEKYRNEHFIGK
jgi:hypothetical protein